MPFGDAVEHALPGRGTGDRTQSAPPRRVLIVDDDPAIVELFRLFFKSELTGYAVTTARDGDAALAALLAERPDVVLLDITMPGMDGLNLLKVIREIDQSLPVIMVTAATQSEPGEALRNGAFAFIPKPVDLRYITHLVATAVECRRTAAATH